jgi:hypothetical protein
MNDRQAESDSHIRNTTTGVSENADHPMTGHNDRWETIIDEMSATATEYRNAGWKTLELHPGDILPLPSENGTDRTDLDSSESADHTPTEESTTQDTSESHTRVGLDIIIPDNEFTQLAEITSGETFDEYESFRAEKGDVVFVVAAIKASASDTVVFVPLYYQASDAERMTQRAITRGEIKLFVRPLSNDRQVVFSQSRPELLLPAEFET